MNHHLAIPQALTEQEAPLALLDATIRHYGDSVALVSSLGPQTLVILDMIHRLGHTAKVIMVDTGVLFPETYALKARVEDRYGIRIHAVSAPAAMIAQQQAEGPTPWTRAPNQCCALRKVAPLREALRGYQAWITGIRADQTTHRQRTQRVGWDASYGLMKINPLLDWRRGQVFAWLAAHRVPYNPLLDQGYTSIGCAPCTRLPDDPTDERSGRWAGTEKTECGLHLPSEP